LRDSFSFANGVPPVGKVKIFLKQRIFAPLKALQSGKFHPRVICLSVGILCKPRPDDGRQHASCIISNARVFHGRRFAKEDHQWVHRHGTSLKDWISFGVQAGIRMKGRSS
jgi:hypothetical protein